jgi:hypothetical protein
MRTSTGRDWLTANPRVQVHRTPAQEVLEWHVEARCAFDVVVGPGADVDGAAGRGDSVGVLLDRGPVEDVEACEVGGAAVSPDPLGDRGSDRSGGSVDDRGLLSSSMCPPFVE